MKKLVAVAAGSAALATMGFLSAGHATSDNGALDVSGNTYAQAAKILQSQGYKAVFQGSVGRVDLPGGDYTMDHSAVVFLVNTQGQVAAIFTPPFQTPKLAEDLGRAAPYLRKS